MDVSYFTNSVGDKLAYVHKKAQGRGSALPAVMFLGGFKSDMSGSKALYLEERCQVLGQEFLRFDYTGHGLSDGEFVDGTIGSWLSDAREMLVHSIQSSSVILVGSSMGGWIALRLLVDPPEDGPVIHGVVGIAAAPDFTEDIKAMITDEQVQMLEEKGYAEQSNEYSDEPYIFTKALFDDGKAQCLLNASEPYKVDAALVLLQGKQDNSVHWKKALRINEVFNSPRSEVVFIDDGDHSLSRFEDLALLDKTLTEMV